MRTHRLYALLASLALAPGAAQALTISANFTASGFGAGAPQDPVSGSFSISVDESALTGVGYESVDGVVEALDLSIAGVVYTPADAEAGFLFVDGVLSTYMLGNNVNPSDGHLYCLVRGPENDFCLRWPLPVPLFSYSSGTGAVYDTLELTVTSAAVPEPAAALVFAAGALLLGSRVRHGREPSVALTPTTRAG